MTFAALLFVMTSPALACPGSTETCDEGSCNEHADADPATCAKAPSLIGANCTFTTGMMAKRVVEEGRPWTFVGRLIASNNQLASHVAAPFVVSGDVFVVANQVLEQVREQLQPGARVNLEGRILEVEGVKYFVLTKGIPVT